MNIQSFPLEIILTIVENTDMIDLARFRLTCWHFYDNDYILNIWRQKVKWKEFLTYHNFPIEFIEKHIDFISTDTVTWDIICLYQTLSEPFIEKYSNIVCWDRISQHQTLSESFIEKYSDKVCWKHISGHQILSEPFIEKYQQFVDWPAIYTYQNVSEEFFIKHSSNGDWPEENDNPKFISDYIPRSQKEKNLWSAICRERRTPFSDNFIHSYAYYIDWWWIIQKQALPEQLIEFYPYLVVWTLVPKFQKLSEQFIEKYFCILNTNDVVIYQSLSEEFIRRNIGKLDWCLLSKHQNLSESFIEEFHSSVCWEHLFLRTGFLSESFIKKWKHKLYV